MDTLFGKTHWFQSLCSNSEWTNVKSKYDGVAEFVRKLLEQVRALGRNEEDFTLLQLAFENVESFKR